MYVGGRKYDLLLIKLNVSETLLSENNEEISRHTDKHGRHRRCY